MRSPGKPMPPMSPSPTDTSMAIVPFDNSTTQFSSSPSPPHSLDHCSESEEEEKCRSEGRRSPNPEKTDETPTPIVVIQNQNLSVREFVPPVVKTKKNTRVDSGRRSSDQRSGGAVLAILRRSKREKVVKFSALGFRLSEVVFALISFSIMAADRTKGWSGDAFYRYKEYRFCLSVNVLAFIYSGVQACDLAYHFVTEKHLISHHLRPLFEFIMDQVLAYLLISASTAAVTRVDDWVSNWGKDGFTEMASGSIAMSFLAFVAFALSSLISGYNLFNRDSF